MDLAFIFLPITNKGGIFNIKATIRTIKGTIPQSIFCQVETSSFDKIEERGGTFNFSQIIIPFSSCGSRCHPQK